MNIHVLTALVLVCSFKVMPSAHAQPTDPDDYINPDRPGLADGSNVVGAGRFQVEAGIEQNYYHGNGGNSQALFIPTLLRLGLDKSLEVRLEGNTYTWTRAYDPIQGVTRDAGMTPTSIGVKYQFAESGGWARPSMGVILRLFPPSGSGNFKTAHATGDFRLVADWDFASEWSLNPNVGFADYEDNAQRPYTAALFALTLNYNPSKALNLFVDTGVQSPETKYGKTSVIFDIGVAYIIGRDLQLDFSVGSGAAGVTSPSLFLSAGISQRF